MCRASVSGAGSAESMRDLDIKSALANAAPEIPETCESKPHSQLNLNDFTLDPDWESIEMSEARRPVRRKLRAGKRVSRESKKCSPQDERTSSHKSCNEFSRDRRSLDLDQR